MCSHLCGAQQLLCSRLCGHLLPWWIFEPLVQPQPLLPAELLRADLCGSGVLQESLLPADLLCACLPPAYVLCAGLPPADLLCAGLQQRLRPWSLLPQGLPPADLLCSRLPQRQRLLQQGWLLRRLPRRLLQSCLLCEACLLPADLCGSGLRSDLLCAGLLQEAQPV